MKAQPRALKGLGHGAAAAVLAKHGVKALRRGPARFGEDINKVVIIGCGAPWKTFFGGAVQGRNPVVLHVGNIHHEQPAYAVRRPGDFSVFGQLPEHTVQFGLAAASLAGFAVGIPVNAGGFQSNDGKQQLKTGVGIVQIYIKKLFKALFPVSKGVAVHSDGFGGRPQIAAGAQIGHKGGSV